MGRFRRLKETTGFSLSNLKSDSLSFWNQMSNTLSETCVHSVATLWLLSTSPRVLKTEDLPNPIGFRICYKPAPNRRSRRIRPDAVFPSTPHIPMQEQQPEQNQKPQNAKNDKKAATKKEQKK
ncbi:Hypothetical_protein [Hexamita inflata]|uniref:Hypothetical_protein n=1 Tax=Hexamita inflata TaxID=28002 RepID=A0AA86QTS2_9EUKA|nr:Hypothetical protein HINF_LOCUS46794 [Hexamita inflata]CAI9959157.1 Hypothetical protein HINF_LOCUS46802 [Hexamita inflata]